MLRTMGLRNAPPSATREMRATGVHARIRPACGGHAHRSAVEPRDPFLQLLLHAASLGLHLPPDEVRAVVLEGELEGGHFESSCTFTTGLEDVSAYANRASR